MEISPDSCVYSSHGGDGGGGGISRAAVVDIFARMI